MRKCGLARILKVRLHWRTCAQTRFGSITSCIHKRYHGNTLAETCIFFKGNPAETYRKVVWFRRYRSHRNMNKHYVSATGNTR